MFEKLPHTPVLVQANSVERNGILGHTPRLRIALWNLFYRDDVKADLQFIFYRYSAASSLHRLDTVVGLQQ